MDKLPSPRLSQTVKTEVHLGASAPANSSLDLLRSPPVGMWRELQFLSASGDWRRMGAADCTR